ncbi:FAD-dependent pyridine nucleotide-disulfide oxidoreductase [Methylacidimicrobium sp. AP8]|uniref:dihydrolipoyl dehydrogenase n=1 Tax=Methylacidimicrobium sp. AP8 TaxID=2730359 RepID=UPI0018C05D12|nr:dihydrolipoyl dehydrogenase [Methylacidimicrobium sp. AP8]CAB4243916.1 FAD-dependent pyridine nucleotide-disulfide oxidoreductase [Methylacidimicrobium sp. AP8]
MAVEFNVDVMILGAGGGGYPAAFRLAAAGRSVVMADPIGNLGGDCLAEGCVPSKTVREASLARTWPDKYPLFGLRGSKPEADWRAVLAHKDRVQSLRYAQHRKQIEESPLVFHKGTGRIVDERTVEVAAEGGELYRYHAKHLILATGSRPHILPIPGAELAVTSHHFFRLGADLPFPRRLVAIGGGYIGLETASMLQNLGAEATVLEATGEILPGVDLAIARFLHQALARRLRILVHAKVTAIERGAAGDLVVRYEQAGEPKSIEADCVLMATGREPVLPEGCSLLGLPTQGKIEVDDRLRTKHAHIYAPGDVNGRSMLFHSAVYQSLVAADDILREGRGHQAMDFRSVPFTVFTEPEAAWVGLTEAEAEREGLETFGATYPYRSDTRAQIFDEDGFLKLLFERKTGRLIGAQIAGMDAAQLIAPLALAVRQGATAETLSYMAFPHPMLSEGINHAARAVGL